MDFKFDKLFDKIVTESKLIKEDSDFTNNPDANNLSGTPGTVGPDSGENVDTEARKKAQPQLSEEQKKANFEAIVEKVKAAFEEYGVDCDESEDEDEDGITLTAEWRWENKNGVDEYLGLSYCEGSAEEENNGGMGDLDLTDVEGTAKYLIDEYLFNPEYGGIGLDDRTLDECVPEFLEEMTNDSDFSDIDWDEIDLDDLAEEFIDEYYDYGFETEDDIKMELEEWVREKLAEEDD